jgi:hypothetical protein
LNELAWQTTRTDHTRSLHLSTQERGELIGGRAARRTRLLLVEGLTRPSEFGPDSCTGGGQLFDRQLGIKICGLASGSCKVPRMGQHVGSAHPDEDASRNLSERQLERGVHPAAVGEHFLGGGGSSPVRLSPVLGPDRRLFADARSLPDMLIATDDVLYQIIDRPL